MACARVRDGGPEFLLRRSIESEREAGDSYRDCNGMSELTPIRVKPKTLVAGCHFPLL